jgi:uncharacterized protein YcbX/ribosomal protein S18 acetylase RimI-like enzyme
MSQKPTLARIRIYPVKSLGGFDRDVWELDAFGLRYDRRWMIVDPDGRFMTQRDYPGMAQIAVEMQADRLILSVPMSSPVAVPLEPEPGASEPVKIWGDTVAARAVSEDANRWLGEVLKTPCRLVYMPEESARSVDSAYVDHNAQLAFADGFPLLLTSEESLAELNERLDEPVSMDRFRPNLVVKGTGGPHAEDTWRRIRLSDMEFHVVKPCSRCVIITTDQNTSERGDEPLQTLAKYRSVDGDVYFGQNVVHLGHGRLRVGDDIQVLETGDPIPDVEAGKAEPAAGKSKPSTGSSGRQSGPRMWSTEPGFELYLPEEPELEQASDAKPELEVEAEIDLASELDSGRQQAVELDLDEELETEAEADVGAGPPAEKPVDDIIFPFEVDLVVTPEDIKEAAKKEDAEADATAEEAVEEPVDEVEEEEPAAEEPEEAAEEEEEKLEEVAAEVEEAAEEEEEEEEEAPAEEDVEEVVAEAPASAEVAGEEAVAGKGEGKAGSKKRARKKVDVSDIEFVLGKRPESSAIDALYEAAGRPETSGDQDPGRIDRAFAASNVVVAAWLGDVLVGVLRGWSDGSRDGFISDLVVHPDHVGAGIGVELVHHAMGAHPGVRWVLRASATSPYLGSALGWMHLGGGWYVSPG